MRSPLFVIATAVALAPLAATVAGPHTGTIIRSVA